jgi:hypothetical protein
MPQPGTMSWCPLRCMSIASPIQSCQLPRIALPAHCLRSLVPMTAGGYCASGLRHVAHPVLCDRQQPHTAKAVSNTFTLSTGSMETRQRAWTHLAR